MRTSAVASLLVVFFLQTVVADVWCRWNSSCVLEASFPVGEDVEVVHWRHTSAGEVYVHSFYDNADQLADQNQRFRGRTSLFKEKLKEGNVSLLLRNVIVGDSGTYKCYVRTSKTADSTFEVHVEAPVTAIQIRQVEDNQLLCSSEGIYPRPQLRWFFGPALAPAPDSTTNISQQAETKLFSVNSSRRLVGDGDCICSEYACEVSASNSIRRITWKKTALNISDTSKRIGCASVTDESGLTWTFNTSELIASRRAGQKYVVADAWAKYVEDLSEDGGLHLRDLTPDRSGEYTCARSNATQTRVNVVFLRVSGQVCPKEWAIVLGVLLLVAVVVIIYYVVKDRRRRCRREPRTCQERMDKEQEENIPLETSPQAELSREEEEVCNGR